MTKDHMSETEKELRQIARMLRASVELEKTDEDRAMCGRAAMAAEALADRLRAEEEGCSNEQ